MKVRLINIGVAKEVEVNADQHEYVDAIFPDERQFSRIIPDAAEPMPESIRVETKLYRRYDWIVFGKKTPVFVCAQDGLDAVEWLEEAIKARSREKDIEIAELRRAIKMLQRGHEAQYLALKRLIQHYEQLWFMRPYLWIKNR